MRSVSGRIRTGTDISAIVAVTAGTRDVRTFSAPVDAQGKFRLTLPKHARYIVELMSGDKQGGATVRFASVPGGALDLAPRPGRRRAR